MYMYMYNSAVSIYMYMYVQSCNTIILPEAYTFSVIWNLSQPGFTNSSFLTVSLDSVLRKGLIPTVTASRPMALQ